MSRTVTLPSGGETLASFDPSDVTVVEAAGSIGEGCVNSLTVPPGTQAKSPVWAAAPEFWCHYFVEAGLPFDPVANDFHLDFFDGATKVLEVLVSGETSMTFDFYTLQGGGGGALAKAFSVVLPTFEAGAPLFDIGLVAGNPGKLIVASSDVVIFEADNLDHSSLAGVTQVAHRAFGDSFGHAANANWAGVIWSATRTIGMRLVHQVVDTASAVNTAITGGVGNVNEIPTDDATTIVSTAAGQCSTFSKAGASLAGLNPIGTIVAMRAMTEGAGPTHLQATERIGGANYSTPVGGIALSADFEACTFSWTASPATGQQYTPAEAAGAEFGATSAA